MTLHQLREGRFVARVVETREQLAVAGVGAEPMRHALQQTP